MNIKELLIEYGVNPIAVVAGTIGGIILIVYDDLQKSFRRGMAQIVSSIAFSGYGTQAVVDHFKLNANGWIGIIGLCLGILGLFIVRGLIVLGSRFEKNPLKFIANAKKEADESAGDKPNT